MPILEAVLTADKFVDAAGEMASSLQFLFSKLDMSFRAMQKFEVTISTFSGSTAQAKNDLARLLENSNKLGVSFEAAAAPFAKFASAAEGLSRHQIFTIFDSFATSLSAVRANGSEVNGVFLALQQIVSKGKLSMEELRLQLAERIPGAMKLAAKAAGMDMQTFEKAVQKGLIDTNKWLLNFADLMKETFGEAAQLAARTFDAAVQRMGNDLLTFNAALVESSDAGTIWGQILDSISQAMLNNEDVFSSTAVAVKDFSLIAQNLVNSVLPSLPTILNLVSGATHLLSRAMGGVSYVANGLYLAIAGVRVGFLELKQVILETINPLNVNKEAIEKNAEAIRNVYGKMFGYADSVKTGLEALTAPYEEITRKVEVLGEVTDNSNNQLSGYLKEMDSYIKDLGKSISDEVKAREKAAKDEENAIKEMYEEAGFGAAAYYDEQAQSLVEQVAKWQEHGADVYKSNQWLYDQLTTLSKEAWDKGETEAGLALDSYSAMYRTLVDQFNESNKFIGDAVGQMAANIDGLNAKDINIQARLDGGAVVQGIDSLIVKFRELQAAAADAKAAGANNYSSYDASSGQSYGDFLQSRENAGLSNGGSSVTVNNNFNQSISRSDVSPIVQESIRQAGRN